MTSQIEEPLTIKVDITKDDVLEALEGSKRRFSAGFIELISFGVIGYITYLICLNIGHSVVGLGNALTDNIWAPVEGQIVGLGPAFFDLLATLPGGLFILLVWVMLFRAYKNNKSKKGVNLDSVQYGTSYGPHSFSFNPDGTTISRPFYRSSNSWRTYNSIEDAKNAILLRQHGNFFDFIPKRAFANPEQAQYFFDRIQSLHQANQRPRMKAAFNPLYVEFIREEKDEKEAQYILDHKKLGPLVLLNNLLKNGIVQVCSFALIALMIISLIWTSLSGATTFNPWPALIFYGVVLGIIYTTSPLVRRVFTPWLLKKDQDSFSNSSIQKIRLFQSGLRLETSDQVCAYSWHAFSKVTKTQRSVILFFESGPAFVTPNRAFRDKAHRDTFAEFAKSHIYESTTQTHANEDSVLQNSPA